MPSLLCSEPMNPAQWGTELLMEYCTLHGIPVDSVVEDIDLNSKRKRLCSLVKSDLYKCYLAVSDISSDLSFDDVLSMCPFKLVNLYLPTSFAAVFREHPSKLRAVVDAGLSYITSFCEVNLNECSNLSCVPMIEWWFSFILDNDGKNLLSSYGQSLVCGRTVPHGDVFVRCFECAADSSCVMCSDCFRRSPCVNHRHFVFQSSGGLCDCGDPFSWKASSFCSQHSGISSTVDLITRIEDSRLEWVKEVIRGLVLYVLKVMGLLVKALTKEQSGPSVDFKLRCADRLLRRAVALLLLVASGGGEVRRLLCLSLLERSSSFHSCSSATIDAVENSQETALVSPLEMFYSYNLELSPGMIVVWERSFLSIFNECVSDPLFRVPFAELLLKYAKQSVLLKWRHPLDLAVQVLSVENVVDAMLQGSSQYSWESFFVKETGIHHLLNALLYPCCAAGATGVSHTSTALPNSLHYFYWLSMMVDASKNTRILVVSRQLFRAWLNILCLVGEGSNVSQATTYTDDYSLWNEHTLTTELATGPILIRLASMVRGVARALGSGEEPVPPWLADRLCSAPETWEVGHTSGSDCAVYSQVCDRLCLRGASALLFDSPDISSPSGVQLSYMRELLKECVESINIAVARKRSAFKKKGFGLLAVDGACGLERYDLLDSSSPDPTSFVISHVRFFGLLVDAWMMLHLENSARDGVSACGKSPADIVMEIFNATGSRIQYWIDEFLMPIVLCAQVEQGLWPRDERQVTMQSLHYMEGMTHGMEMDAHLLQLFMLFVPSEVFAIQVLQRYSYPKDSPAVGYGPFLRLILTLCVAECCAPIYNEADLEKAVRYRLVHELASGDGCSFERVNGIVGRLSDSFPRCDIKSKLPSILKDFTVQVKQADGVKFRLNSAQTWRSDVNMFHPLVRDRHVAHMLDLYESLVRREQREEAAGSDGAVPHGAPVSLPPPRMRWIGDGETQPEQKLEGRTAPFRDKVCLLLQTSAVLSVAIDIVHRYTCHTLINTRVALPVSKTTLSQAISVIYLATRACRMISCCRSNAVSSSAINWEVVEEFQRVNNVLPPYLPCELEKLYPVAGIASAATLKEKLEVPVGATAPLTTVEALQSIFQHFQKSEEDSFSIVAMTRYILQGVGAMPFTSEDEEDNCNTLLAQNNRRMLLKKKQAALFGRIKAKYSESVLAFEKSKSDESAPTPAKDATPRLSSVTAVLLLRLMEAECCMCYDTTSEPLLLLGSVSTSDSLDRLEFNDLEQEGPLQHKARAHLYLCGHAVHTRCANKALGPLAHVLSQGGAFLHPLHSILAPTEINCPICLMLCNVLCPFPTMDCIEKQGHPVISSSGHSMPTGPIDESSLFQIVHRSMQDAPVMEKWKATRIQDPHRRICWALSSAKSGGISESAIPTERSDAVPEEPVCTLFGVLQCIRTLMCASLECVKVGDSVRYNDLLAMFCLMVSLKPRALEENKKQLCAALVEEGDGFCLLLVKTLLQSRDVTMFVAEYTTALLCSDSCAQLITTVMESESDLPHNGLLIALWRELGCLTFLKAIMTDTVEYDDLMQVGDGQVNFFPLTSGALTDLASLRRAVTVMLLYLLNVPRDNGSQNERSKITLSSIVRSVVEKGGGTDKCLQWDLPICPQDARALVQCKRHHVAYEGVLEWRHFILSRVFRLPNSHTQLLLDVKANAPCSVCDEMVVCRWMCCLCGKFLCGASQLGHSEFELHVAACSSAIGIYFCPYKNCFLVQFTRNRRFAYLPGLYSDQYGQRKPSKSAGCSLTLCNDASLKWLSVWIRSLWAVEYKVVTQIRRTSPGQT